MAESSPPRDRRLSRRQFIPGAAGVVALGAAGAAGYELRGGSHHESAAVGSPNSSALPAPPSDAAAASTVVAGVQSFFTRPDLRPPAITVDQLQTTTADCTAPRFVVLGLNSSPKGIDAQHGVMIVDRQGRMVYFNPLPAKTYNVDVQTYGGKPVLTWWHGGILDNHGVGGAMIADSSYRVIHQIGSTKQTPIDLHEFNLTSSGTALLTSYQQQAADLSSIGGTRQGSVWACHALEVDIASGEVVFDWNSMDHVDVSESHLPLPSKLTQPYDYFHMNAVCEIDDDTLLVSGRNTWTLYAVERSSGTVLWRLNGKQSDFTVPHDAAFSWQHDARAYGSTTITLFDNGMNTSNHSRGLVLGYDTSTRQVELSHAYEHPAAFQSGSLGSVQLFPDRSVLVGWGVQPYYSAFTESGTMLYDAQLPVSLYSYRAFAVDWVGHPTDKPAIAARQNPSGGFAVYASWNGATEIDHWTVLAGANSSSLKPVGSQPWSGFETSIAVNSDGPSFAVAAIDRAGNELGRSEVV